MTVNLYLFSEINNLEGFGFYQLVVKEKPS